MTQERILIVEDEDIVSELLLELLQNLGYEVAGTTPFGEEAVELAASTHPDLILMDIKLLGGMNGMEAAGLIRDRFDIPVVYLTAFSDDKTILQAKSTAPFGYIQKPFKGGEVRSAIEIALYRSRMERMLKEREHSYRVLAENLPGIVYRLHLRGERHVQFFNNMARQMTGYENRELNAGDICPLGVLVLPEDLPTTVGGIEKALAQDEPFAMEYRIRRKDGGIRHFLNRGRPSRGEDGTPSQIDGVIFDITEQKNLEEELKNANKSLDERKSFAESIVTNIQSGIIVTDAELNITLANPYVASVCGRAREEIVNTNLWAVCPELARSIASGENRGEMSLAFFGCEVTLGFSRFALQGTDRADAGHIVTFKDLSEIVKIRHEMRNKERLATMGEVVARVAHEMRNPLFAITAVAQILGMELKMSPPQRELMDALLTEGKRLNSLVAELLDCSKEMRLNRKTLELSVIMRNSLRICDSYKPEKNITIRTNCGELSTSITVDPDKLEQVLINLLQNAVDASPVGGIIDLTVEEGEDTVSIKIADSGQGVDAVNLDKIFEVFFTTKKQGTGLGLHISRKIVDAHGGSLSVSNNPGRGATFTVVLPFATGGQ
jgi:PAS domain S-box-containing protein